MTERNVVKPVEWLAGILKMCLSWFINGFEKIGVRIVLSSTFPPTGFGGQLRRAETNFGVRA